MRIKDVHWNYQNVHMRPHCMLYQSCLSVPKMENCIMLKLRGLVIHTRSRRQSSFEGGWHIMSAWTAVTWLEICVGKLRAIAYSRNNLDKS